MWFIPQTDPSTVPPSALLNFDPQYLFIKVLLPPQVVPPWISNQSVEQLLPVFEVAVPETLNVGVSEHGVYCTQL